MTDDSTASAGSRTPDDPTDPLAGPRQHRLTVTAPYPDAELARVVADAIALDAGAVEGDRSVASVTREDDVVTVTIDADDPSALRAAKRTWFGLLDAAERTALVSGR